MSIIFIVYFKSYVYYIRITIYVGSNWILALDSHVLCI